MLKLRFFLLIILCLLLSACQKPLPVTQAWQPKVGPQTLYRHPLIQKSNAPFWIMPINPPQQPLKAIFFPFELHKIYENRERISKQLSRIFWKTWLIQEVFPALEFMENNLKNNKQAALKQAQKLNADLFINGQITDFMSGGSQGTTKIALKIDIYSVPKAELIWSMEHAGRIENSISRDYILFQMHTQMPTSPAYVLINALAHDLAQPVKNWNYDHSWENNRQTSN